MTYILTIGPWHVGPFPTHAAATWWAEVHGVDSYDMLQVDDPAEAPAKIQRLTTARYAHLIDEAAAAMAAQVAARIR